MKSHFERVNGILNQLCIRQPTHPKVDDFWEPAKKQLLMDARGFMDSLVKFDKDNIPDRIIKKVGNTSVHGFLIPS